MAGDRFYTPDWRSRYVAARAADLLLKKGHAYADAGAEILELLSLWAYLSKRIAIMEPLIQLTENSYSYCGGISDDWAQEFAKQLDKVKLPVADDMTKRLEHLLATQETTTGEIRDLVVQLHARAVGGKKNE